jgi:hypothetical protein
MAKSKAKSKSGTRAKAKAKAKGKSKSKTRSKSKKRSSGGRELIAPRGDKRFVRRAPGGEFSESDDVGRSLSTDRRRKAKTKSKRGEGDRGDR